MAALCCVSFRPLNCSFFHLLNYYVSHQLMNRTCVSLMMRNLLLMSLGAKKALETMVDVRILLTIFIYALNVRFISRLMTFVTDSLADP